MENKKKQGVSVLNELQKLTRIYYSKTCLKRTPYIPETWTNGK